MYEMQSIVNFFNIVFCIRSITRDTIPEETYNTSSLRRPSWFSQSTTSKRRPSLQKQQTVGVSLMDYASSPSPSESSADEDIECLMKAGFWYQEKPCRRVLSLSSLKNNVNNYFQVKYSTVSGKLKHKFRGSK